METAVKVLEVPLMANMFGAGVTEICGPKLSLQ